MAEWNVDLPATAVEGAETHVEDHNAVYDAIKEVRTNVDEIEDAVPAWTDITGKPATFPAADPAWADVTGKPASFPPADHKHDAADIDAGTLAAARIPTLAQSKVTGLAAALEGKADAADLADLVARVVALEEAQE